MQQPGNQLEVHFACAPGYLDIHSLSYRWFGAVWTRNERLQQIVRGYWFGDEKEDLIRQAKHAGWKSLHEVNDVSCIKQIYESFRKKQQELDWNKRSCLPLRSLLSKPWRTAKSGWYILRSREQYPLYLSSVQKRGWLVYLMHTAVCENDTDKLNFLNMVNYEHDIELQECPWTRGLQTHGGVSHEYIRLYTGRSTDKSRRKFYPTVKD